MNPQSMLIVMCDTRNMKTIAINCRCGARWTERVPQEVHDSNLVIVFDCVKCGRHHLLRNHELRSLDKGALDHDRPKEYNASFGVDTSKYDA